MILLFHIAIAIASLVHTTFLYIAPSRSKLRISYTLVALTVASGTLLVVLLDSPLLKTCMVGLVYLGIVSAGIIAARHKLMRATQE